jgi:hypothetical protein
MRLYLTDDAATKIYKAMIVPLMTYNSIINLNLTTCQRYRLRSINRRAKQVAGGTEKFNDIENTMKKDACIFLKKCLNNELCLNFDNYFDIVEHNKNTRQGLLLRLPRIKLESTKNAFFFTGAKIFNDLPNKLRNIADTSIFKNKLKEFY